MDPNQTSPDPVTPDSSALPTQDPAPAPATSPLDLSPLSPAPSESNPTPVLNSSPLDIPLATAPEVVPPAPAPTTDLPVIDSSPDLPPIPEIAQTAPSTPPASPSAQPNVQAVTPAPGSVPTPPANPSQPTVFIAQDLGSQPLAEPGAISSVTTGGRSKMKVLLVALIGFFVLTLFGAGAGAYAIAYEKVKLGNPAIENAVSQVVFSLPFTEKTPKYLFAQSVLAHEKISKQSFNLSFLVKSDEITSAMGTNSIDGELKGSVDITDEENIKGTMTLSVTKDFNMDFRILGKKVYMKVNKVPPMLTTLAGIDSKGLDRVFENWVMVDTSTLNTEAQKNMADRESKNKTDEATDKFLQALTSEKVMGALKVSNDKVDNFDTYKISLSATKDMIDYLEDALNEAADNPTKKTSSLNLNTGKVRASDSIKNLDIEIWIDKKDYYMRKVALYSRIQPPNMNNSFPTPFSVLGVEAHEVLGVSTPTSLLNSNPETSFDFVMKFSDFGQAVNVEAPAKSIAPEEFVKLAMEQSPAYIQSVNLSGDSTRRVDLQMLNSALKACYSTNRKYPKVLDEIKTGSCGSQFKNVSTADPVSKLPYEYSTNTAQTTFTLKAVLSDGTNYKVTEKGVASAPGGPNLLAPTSAPKLRN